MPRDHILPVVVVGGKEYDGLPLFVVAVHQLAVHHPVAAFEGRGRGKEVVDKLHGDVG